jgi:UDP-N-acetylglucosamine 2-epimerase
MMKKKKISLVLGIRPDVIRASKLINLLRGDSNIDFEFIWSGQHYSHNLKNIFFAELNVGLPDVELGAKGKTDAEISSNIILKLYKHFIISNPDAVIFLGDTNTVLGCIAAAQLNIPIVHIEGCMRSYDWRMPEEKYRTVIDHLSDIIYTYYDEYKVQGVNEGLRSDSIVVIGNLIVDVLEEQFFSKRKIYMEIFYNLSLNYKISKDNFILATIHRRENVENRNALTNILELMCTYSKTIIFPASYRTQNKINDFNLKIPQNVVLIDPIGYEEILALMSNAYAVLTDSGTIVEETAVIGVPSIQARVSTERPQVYDLKSSVKFNPIIPSSDRNFEDIWQKVEKVKQSTWTHNLGDGKSSERILSDLINRIFKQDGFNNHLPEKLHLDISRSFMEDGL